jgi:hypothetical protein
VEKPWPTGYELITEELFLEAEQWVLGTVKGVIAVMSEQMKP